MSQKTVTPLREAIPADLEERRLLKSQMWGFVFLPIVGMALLGVVIICLEMFR